jgi:tight adherence protein B
MFAALLVFVVSTCAIAGTYLAITMVPGLLQRRRVDRRLRELSIPAAPLTPNDSVVVPVHDSSMWSQLAARTRSGRRLQRLIEQSGVRTSSGAVIVLSVLAGIAAIGLGLLFVRPLWIVPALGIAAAMSPTAWLMRKRSVRMRRFEELFPEALDLLSRAIKAGHAFQTAMAMVAEEMPDPVGPEFRKTFDQQNFGLPLRDALNALVERVQIMDVKFFVTAVLIQRDTGGNLSEILDNLAHVVRDRFKVLRQVRVHTAHGRFTGWVLLALPAALAIALSFINPEHMQLLFREPMGQTMLVAAAVMQTIGFFWIKRVIKIEV